MYMIFFSFHQKQFIAIWMKIQETKFHLLTAKSFITLLFFSAFICLSFELSTNHLISKKRVVYMVQNTVAQKLHIIHI